MPDSAQEADDAALVLVVGQRYPVGQRRCTLTPRLAEATARCRAALVEAARYREVMTYGELSRVIGSMVLPRHMGPLLHMLGHDCAERGEPDLAALVVSASTGEVSTPDSAWARPERQACWDYWGSGA
nr:hypothetical protein [Actinomyces sp.]